MSGRKKDLDLIQVIHPLTDMQFRPIRTKLRFVPIADRTEVFIDTALIRKLYGGPVKNHVGMIYELFAREEGDELMYRLTRAGEETVLEITSFNTLKESRVTMLPDGRPNVCTNISILDVLYLIEDHLYQSGCKGAKMVVHDGYVEIGEYDAKRYVHFTTDTRGLWDVLDLYLPLWKDPATNPIVDVGPKVLVPRQKAEPKPKPKPMEIVAKADLPKSSLDFLDDFNFDDSDIDAVIGSYDDAGPAEVEEE